MANAPTHPLKPSCSSYDLVVIGSGPGGHRGAVQAAKLGKRVLVVEKGNVGGSCIHLGTIPSKALREAALASERGIATLREAVAKTHEVIDEEREVSEEHFRRNKIEWVRGVAAFVDATTLRITNEGGAVDIGADKVLIATGTRPRRPADLPFDGVNFVDSDSVVSLSGQPKTMLVIGAGVIGCEYASIYARLGIKVTLIDSRPEVLSTMDREIVEALFKQFEKSGMEVRLSTTFEDVKIESKLDGCRQVNVALVGGGKKESRAFDVVLFCLGRVGNHESLNLPAIGLGVDSLGLLTVDSNYRTEVSNVYAVGDIIGSPALAASSSEQGRLAVLHAFTGEKPDFPQTFPFGIYTIPEMSSVGVREDQLSGRRIPYVVGKAPYRILARGKMLDDEFGFLKLIVHAKTRRIVGVHVIGTSATELVHIGQIAMSFGATVDFFVDNVFNFPTLAEAYKVAAYNAEDKLSKL
jgi:NAD(P) transhydrogenase